MRIKAGENRHDMIASLFFRLLPVQVALVAMGSINSIVDGIIAARFIDAASVGVVGLYYTLLRVLEAAGAILLGGVSVLSGRYLGSGRIDKTRGVCSLGLAAAFLIGAFLTIASFAAPGTIAVWLGADALLKKPLSDYILGYAVGIIPALLAQQFAASLQLERQDRLGQVGILVMIFVNVSLDILFVAVLNLGVWGLAMATSVANWAYFLTIVQFYFTPRAQLKPSVKLVPWRELPGLLRIGFPNALLVFCLAIRSLAINRILLAFSGEAGLSALSAFNMINGLILAVALGAGAVVRMLSSVFFGEENREGILALMKVAFTRVMVLILGITAAVLLLSPTLAGVFFPDRGSEVFRLTKQLFIVNAFCIPLSHTLIAYSNYCQSAGHHRFVNMISMTDGFFSVVIPSLLLAPLLGALGVWLSFPIGLFITISVCIVHAVLRQKGWPRRLAEWLMLPPDFGTAEHLVLELSDMPAVTRTAMQVQRFCEERGIPRKQSMYAGLCLEEMAANVVEHGFHADRKPHVVEIRVVISSGGVVLRIKDDCIPFDPKERHEMTVSDDPTANIGIRLMYSLADEVEYQNLLGLNVLTIHVSDAISADSRPSSNRRPS